MKRILVLSVLFLMTPQLTHGQSKARMSEAGASTKTFVSSREGLDDTAATDFVEFSFDYPSSWVLDPSPVDDKIRPLAQVHRERPDAPEFLEFISIGNFEATCSMLDSAEVRQVFSEAINKLAVNFFSQTLSDLQVVSESRARIGKYDAYEIRLQGSKEYEGKGRVITWARMVFVPGVKRIDGKVRGVSLTMFATSLMPEVKGAADVGLKGELSVILNSFRFTPANLDNRLGPPETRVTKVMTGTGLQEVDGNKEIVNPTVEFTPQSEITFLWQATNVRNGTVFREVVVAEDRAGAGDNDNLAYQEDVPVEADGPCGVMKTRTREVKPGENGWAVGKYRFEIYQDGKLVRSVPFKVKDSGN